MSNRHSDWMRQAEADVRHAANGFDAGAPTDYYTAQEAEGAIRDTNLTLTFRRPSPIAHRL